MTQHPSNSGAIPPDPTNFDRFYFSREKQPPRTLPQFGVVLLKNADADMMFVVYTVMELTRLCRTEATHKMWQSYYDGKSVILKTHKERAELFVELFALRGLKTAIEPG